MDGFGWLVSWATLDGVLAGVLDGGNLGWVLDGMSTHVCTQVCNEYFEKVRDLIVDTKICYALLREVGLEG
jgi:hypothetical protein